jgi:hypothetical protein
MAFLHCIQFRFVLAVKQLAGLTCCHLLLMLCLSRSLDALAPVGLSRYDVDRLSAPLVGGLPFRFTSMLQASTAA